jgi:hypothetical protein
MVSSVRPRHATLAIALMLFLASAEYLRAETAQDPQTPDFKVQIWGVTVTEFTARVDAYFELRTRLEKDLPPLTATDDPAVIRKAVHLLSKRIRAARAGSREGDIFTPTISVEFRKALVEMDVDTWAAIMDENPGELSNQVNVSYPEDRPLSLVPPNVLAVLPKLPDNIQYRFTGRHLILLDTRAGVILDRIPDAIQCAESCRSARR